jgi:hypothetical protein
MRERMIMKNEINALIEAIKNDYAMNFRDMGDPDRCEIRNRMYAEFCEGITVEEGRKYIKILTNRAVWGFVVAVDNDKKFRKGDILKPAGFNAPARNAPRGNILDGGYVIRWTGPLYLV